MSYTLTLSNGKVFSGLEVSGTCFVSGQPITEADFDGGLRHVVLAGTPEEFGETAPFEIGELPTVKLGSVFMVGDKYYFSIEPIDQTTLERERNRADIEYLAMMTGVEL